MEVIGVGFGRTGTSSLKLALEELGYRSFHTYELFLNPSILYDWCEGIFSKPSYSLGKPNFEAIVRAGYTATTDFPLSLYYEQLLELYPNAKFILTTHKTPEAWFASFKQHVEHLELVLYYVPWLPFLAKIGVYTRWVIAGLHNGDASFMSGNSPIEQNATLAIQSYQQHIERVRRIIPAKQLLEFEHGGGWEPLCNFLEKPIPSKAYPKTNSTLEVKILSYFAVVFLNGLLLCSLLIVLKLLKKALAKKEKKD